MAPLCQGLQRHQDSEVVALTLTFAASTDVSVCGYALPARPSSSSSGTLSVNPSVTASGSLSANPSATAAEGNSGTGNGTPLNNGQLAGTIVGSILGGLLVSSFSRSFLLSCACRLLTSSKLIALLLLLLLSLRRRRDRSHAGEDPNSPPRPLSSLFSMRGNSPAHASEKGLIGANGPAGVSSPTMHSGTGMSGKGGGMTSTGTLGTTGPGGLGAAAAAFGAAGAGGAALASSGRGGNVLPRVRDENQDGDRFIEQGSEVSVLWP